MWDEAFDVVNGHIAPFQGVLRSSLHGLHSALENLLARHFQVVHACADGFLSGGVTRPARGHE